MKTQKQSVFIYVCFISTIVVWWFLWYQYSYDSKQANIAAGTTVSNFSKAFEENILGMLRISRIPMSMSAWKALSISSGAR